MSIVEIFLLSMLAAAPLASAAIQEQSAIDEANKLRESGNLNESRDVFERVLKAVLIMLRPRTERFK